jgi:hypothetical protein
MPNTESQKYPVPRHASQLIVDWAEELSRELGRPVEQILGEGLSAHDFSTRSELHIKLMDGSFVQFHCAFHVVNESKCAIAVFTEHCGHHVFPFHDAVITRITSEHVYRQE